MTSQALRTQGVVLQRGDGGAPEAFTEIGEVKSFNGPGGTASEIDVTTLTSTAKEFLVGLQDEGQFTFELNYVPQNAQQAGLRADRAANTLRNFRLVLTDVPATILAFSAYVMGFQISGAPDSVIGGSVTLRISGAVTTV